MLYERVLILYKGEAMEMQGIWAADAHTDFLLNVRQGRVALDADLSLQQHVSLPALQQGQVGIQMFAAYVDQGSAQHPTVQCLEMIDDYHRMLETWGADVIAPVTAENIQTIGSSGKIGAILSVEGGEACAGSLEVLDMYARLGVRAMTLTWNYVNEIGVPACLQDRTYEGLTDFGRRCVHAMNQRHMAIDVSHLNIGGFWDAMEHSSQPIFASHSNARAVCNHTRNLQDEQIKAIIEAGGYIGLNFCDAFIVEEGPCTLSDLMRHALHILELGGEEVLGLGSDFDGIDTPPMELKGAQDFPALVDAFERAGLNRTLIEKIMHGNFIRYMQQFV